MKKALLFLIKIGLFVFFIYNLGVINYITNLEKHPPAPLKENFRESDMAWLNEKYEKALELEELYSPELYFKDIAEIQLRLNNNEIDRRAVPCAHGTISNLAYLFHQNFDQIRFRSKLSKKEKQEYVNRISEASLKYEEIFTPGITERRSETNKKISDFNYWICLVIKLIKWLFNQYFKNLLPAFILLWIWWIEKQKTIKIKNPLSFLLCLLLYPVVITKTWYEKLRNEARYLIMTVNYRQRQVNLFSIFSENEIKEIKKFANSNISLRRYQEILSNEGLPIRHSLILSLSISLLFIILNCKELNANSNILLNDTETFELCVNSPPLILDYVFLNFDDIFLEIINFAKLQFSNKTKKYFQIKEKCLSGFSKIIDHVPIIIVN